MKIAINDTVYFTISEAGWKHLERRDPVVYRAYKRVFPDGKAHAVFWEFMAMFGGPTLAIGGHSLVEDGIRTEPEGTG